MASFSNIMPSELDSGAGSSKPGGSQAASRGAIPTRSYEDNFKRLFKMYESTLEDMRERFQDVETENHHLRKKRIELSKKLKLTWTYLDNLREYLANLKIKVKFTEGGLIELLPMPKEIAKETSPGKTDTKELEGGGGKKMGGDEPEGGGTEGETVEMEEVKTSGGGDVDEDDAGDEEESFIRIRSQDDGIFEQEDEEDDEYFDFPMPEVEMKEQSPTASRKRKQEISYLSRDDIDDLVEISDEEYMEQYFQPEQYLTNDPGVFRKRNKEQRFSPLYMLNPDDYAHDQKKQIQIKRAIITYRHHKEKKETILRQKEEIKQLRLHNDALKAKVLELSGCGCQKNCAVDLEVVDVVIPSVPTRLYLKGNRSGVGSSSSSGSQSAGNTPKPSAGKPAPQTNSTTSPSSKINVREEAKPLINITSSRLANLNCKSMTTATLRPPLAPPVNKLLNTSVASRPRVPTRKYFIKPGNGKSLPTSIANPEKTKFIPVSSLKSEPGFPISVSLLDDHNRSPMVTNTITTAAGNCLPLGFKSVKLESGSPATAAPASRIVFARKGGTNSNAIQTASQILFGTKTIPTGAQFISNTNVQANSSSRPLTASQLALGSRDSMSSIPFNPINKAVRLPTQQSQSSQVFRTASGQVLQLVQSVPSARVPSTSVERGRRAPNFLPIKPKPTPELNSLDDEIRRRQVDKKSLEEMWRQLDDNDEDEMAIIAAITGTSPTQHQQQQQRNRKQTITNRPNSQDNSSVPSSSNNLYSKKVIEVDGGNIELQRYADIVFEEAN